MLNKTGLAESECVLTYQSQEGLSVKNTVMHLGRNKKGLGKYVLDRNERKNKAGI